MSASSDLPVETLCSIFRSMSEEPFAYFPGRLGWIPPATHVCRKWRRAAIGLADLWAENLCTFTSDAATDTFLERAQSAPLVFNRTAHHFPAAAGLTSHQIALAETHIARIRVFKQPGPLPTSFVQALGGSPLPQLNVLNLHRWTGIENGSFLANFSLRAPVLQELYLDSVFFMVDAPLLRVLSVTNDDRAYQGRLQGVPASEILSVLKATPRLEELKLEGLHALSAEEELDGMTYVELPKLKFLRLKDEGNDYSMYRLVRGAPTADVSIENTACDSGTELAATFASLEVYLRASTYDSLIVYEEQDDGGTHVNVRLRSSASLRKHHDDDGEPEFRLDAFMSPADDEVSCCEIITTLVPHINIDAIRFLDVGEIGTDEYVEVETQDVSEMLAPFTSVTTVMLNIDASRRHILAIGNEDGDIQAELEGTEDEEAADEEGDEDEDEDENENENGVDQTDLPLPALQHLVVQDLTSSHAMSIDELKEAWGILLGILKERKRAGRPVRYLTLSEGEKFSGVMGEDLAAMQERDQQYLRRAEGLVESISDSRGYEKSFRGSLTHSGRLTDYVLQL